MRQWPVERNEPIDIQWSPDKCVPQLRVTWMFVSGTGRTRQTDYDLNFWMPTYFLMVGQ